MTRPKMRLWLLRPLTGVDEPDDMASPWFPWYEKCFGFVVRAETEQRARELAQAAAGDEAVGAKYTDTVPAWTDASLSSCSELDASGDEGIVLTDLRSA